MRRMLIPGCLLLMGLLAGWPASPAISQPLSELIYDPGQLKVRDSLLKVAVGDVAPDFTLTSVRQGRITLSDFKGKKNVVLSFVPAAWTPVCSDQWPGYNILEQLFAQHDAVLLGITVDNVPTLSAWTEAMGGLWFPVLSDFWPHGAAADSYGLLRSDGTSERTIIVIDKQGVIRLIDVSDIDKRPNLETLVQELNKLH